MNGVLDKTRDILVSAVVVVVAICMCTYRLYVNYQLLDHGSVVTCKVVHVPGFFSWFKREPRVLIDDEEKTMICGAYYFGYDFEEGDMVEVYADKEYGCVVYKEKASSSIVWSWVPVILILLIPLSFGVCLIVDKVSQKK